MKVEYLIECLKELIKSTIESTTTCILSVLLSYYIIELVLKTIYSGISYLVYLIQFRVEQFVKEILVHIEIGKNKTNTLCFDLLRGVYEQKPNVKSIFDINPFWEKKAEPRFDSCAGGLSTVLSRHCKRLMLSNDSRVKTLESLKNIETWTEMALRLGDCVGTVSSVINDYCSWTETNDVLAKKTNIKSLFDYLSFIGAEQHSFKEGSSFEICEKELSNAISHQCDWFKQEPINLGFIFDKFETFCFEQRNDFSVKLCVDGLYSVVTHNCALVKMQNVIINDINDAVSKLSDLLTFFEKNILFVALLGVAGYVFYLALAYIYKKWCHYFLFDNNFLKKYPQDKNDIILVNDLNGNQEDTIIKLMNGNPPEFNVVGLDCEIASDTANKGRPCPAILQMARPDGYCAIFQLYHLQNNEFIEKILNNTNTLLVGVGVLNDVNNLKVGWNLKSKRCLDIRHLAHDLRFPTPYSLKGLANNLLGVKCKKNMKLGPWENLDLTENQVNYAVQDARLSVKIFMELNNRKICQKFSWKKRLLWSEKTYWKHSLTLWEGFIDKFYDYPQPVTVHKPLLSNCLPPNDFRSSFPYAYQPESNRTIEPVYQRVCVVCGSTDEGEISMKAIVPLEYRIRFSKRLPHYLDLCKSCIIKNQKEDFLLRNYLADASGAPYPTYMTEELLSLKMIAKWILQNKTKMEHDLNVRPAVSALVTSLSEQLQLSKQNLFFTNIEILSNMDCWPFSPHADAVFNFVNQNFTDTEIIRRIWCDHFVHTMKPVMLPESWKQFYRWENLLQQPYI